jgi:hypothetical protein
LSFKILLNIQIIHKKVRINNNSFVNSTLKIFIKLIQVKIIQIICKIFKVFIHLKAEPLEKYKFKYIEAKISQITTKSAISLTSHKTDKYFISQTTSKMIQATKTFLEFNFLVKNNITFDSTIQIKAIIKGKSENNKATDTVNKEVAIQRKV